MSVPVEIERDLTAGPRSTNGKRPHLGRQTAGIAGQIDGRDFDPDLGSVRQHEGDVASGVIRAATISTLATGWSAGSRRSILIKVSKPAAAACLSTAGHFRSKHLAGEQRGDVTPAVHAKFKPIDFKGRLKLLHDVIVQRAAGSELVLAQELQMFALDDDAGVGMGGQHADDGLLLGVVQEREPMGDIRQGRRGQAAPEIETEHARQRKDHVAMGLGIKNQQAKERRRGIGQSHHLGAGEVEGPAVEVTAAGCPPAASPSRRRAPGAPHCRTKGTATEYARGSPPAKCRCASQRAASHAPMVMSGMASTVPQAIWLPGTG